MSVIIGASNVDGSGSSLGLNSSNGITVSDNYQFDGVRAFDYNSNDGSQYSSLYLYTESWGETYKEAYVNGHYEEATIDNVTDVSLINQSDLGYSALEVLGAKRGYIDTSGVDSDDSLFIGVESNSASWSNLFTINTGEGDDQLVMGNFGGTQWTEFDIDMGTGEDIVDISELSDALSYSQTRQIEGGEGFDVLITNGDDVVEFSGFEVIHGSQTGQSLTVDSALIESNAQSEMGLVIVDLDVELAGNLDYHVDAVDRAHHQYLEELNYDADSFSQITIHIDDDDYTLLTNDADFALA